ncbi:MAG: hypothetical protein QCI38_04205 [Candidatus Thermoplasmatota archaeon]|nr:hypothetical protein [Candidatus Thermoplasmatota archaeon]
MTLAVDEDLYTIVKNHPEVSWSEVARRAMRDYANKLKIMDRIAEKSKLTEEDVEEIDKLLKKGIHARHEERNA